MEADGTNNPECTILTKLSWNRQGKVLAKNNVAMWTLWLHPYLLPTARLYRHKCFLFHSVADRLWSHPCTLGVTHAYSSLGRPWWQRRCCITGTWGTLWYSAAENAQKCLQLPAPTRSENKAALTRDFQAFITHAELIKLGNVCNMQRVWDVFPAENPMHWMALNCRDRV